MQFDPPLQRATFLKRYKRFFADFELPSGEIVTSACANTGRMTGLLNEGTQAWIQPNDNPKRKLKWDWWVVAADDTLVGCHTGLPNTLGFRAVCEGLVPELTGYATVEKEKKYGEENSRIDLLLSQDGRRTCYVEIKNVHMRLEPGVASFPDAVTERGLKHLRELSLMVAQGHRAVMFYIVQRGDVTAFRPAHEVDPAYAAGLKEAQAAGVEIIAYSCHVAPTEITLAKPLKIIS